MRERVCFVQRLSVVFRKRNRRVYDFVTGSRSLKPQFTKRSSSRDGHLAERARSTAPVALKAQRRITREILRAITKRAYFMFKLARHHTLHVLNLIS